MVGELRDRVRPTWTWWALESLRNMDSSETTLAQIYRVYPSFLEAAQKAWRHECELVQAIRDARVARPLLDELEDMEEDLKDIAERLGVTLEPS